MMMNWDDAFANSAYIPGAELLPDLWARRAAEYRQATPGIEEAIHYGPHPRHKLDLIRPKGACRGLVVFVHGGFWLRFDRGDWTDLAEGARANGWAVALPGYRLAPEAGLPEIAQDIAVAVIRAASLVEGPIRLAGHSAGGHLVTRLICEDSPLPHAVRSRIEHVVSISGVHDLRPLRLTAMNTALGLSDVVAVQESPALRLPAAHARLTCWVGTDERPEFLRQSRLMAMIWEGLAETRLVEESGKNHFSILDGLRDPAAPIVRELLYRTAADPSQTIAGGTRR